MNPTPDLTAVLASLRERWGPAAPRPGAEIIGALAMAPLIESPTRPVLHAPGGGVFPTGFPELDALLGLGGLPRSSMVALRGTGAATLALRLAAEAQRTGATVAYLDLARCLDPLDAAARGVRLADLVVALPESLDEAFGLAGALLGGRLADLLVLDLWSGPLTRITRPRGSSRLPSSGERLRRLAALARRAGALVVLLDPPEPPAALGTAVDEAAGLRIEFRRRALVRLRRDLVGQRVEAHLARSHVGPPAAPAELLLLYGEGTPRDACLERPELFADHPPGRMRPVPVPLRHLHPGSADATPPSSLAAPPPWLRPIPLERPDAVAAHRGRRDRARRQPGGASPRRPAGDPDGARPASGA